MAKYQLAPYRVTTKPRRNDGAEVLRVDSITLEEASLLEVWAWTLRDAASRGPLQSAADRDLQFSVSDVRTAKNALSFVVTRGSTGIQSTLRKGDEVYERDEGHREDISFRTMLVAPPNGHHGILLTERIGIAGVSTFVRKLLLDTVRERAHEVTMKIEPLTTATDIERVDLAVKELVFKLPNPADHAGRMEGLTGRTGRFELRYRARNLKLSRFTGSDGKRIEPSQVFGVLSDGMGLLGARVTAEGVSELGVEADLAVQLPNGSTRTFTMGSTEGPALVYSIEADEADSAHTMRPSDQKFQDACQTVVADFAGRFDVNDTTAQLAVMPGMDRAAQAPEDWKAVWNVATDGAAGR